MLIAEYSYEEDIQVKQQEAEQLGRTKGRQEGLILSGRIRKTEWASAFGRCLFPCYIQNNTNRT